MKNVIFIVLISLSTSMLSQQNIDLFIWAGQSNALGRQGDAVGYPADTGNEDTQIRFNWTVANGSNSGGWTTMQPQTGYFTAGHFGPEVTFGRQLLRAGYNPAIFKFTQGATSIFQHWRGPGDAGLYDNMVASLNNAITALQNQGHTVTIRGFVWIQGESDSNSDAAANAYATNLTNIINDLRNNVVQNANLPIILGVDEQYFNITDHERHQILNAHQNLALNDTNIKFTSMYGYPKADVTHLSPVGLIAHGEDLFESYQLLISGVTNFDNCTLVSTGNHRSLAKTAWGQSFKTDCSGNVYSITFEALSTHNGAATFTLHNGADCSGTVLHTQTLNSIINGDNTVMMPAGLYLDKEHTYYFEITSNTNTNWRINFSDTNDANNVIGVLRTVLNGDNCGRTYLDYDMAFSVALVNTSQCANSSNVYSFIYDNKSYEIIKENKNWIDAAACAVHRGGYLTEINSQAEQDAIFNELQNNAGITVSNTVAPDGGNASYVWIGANDLNTEGQWVWDGNNDGNTTLFWQGGRNGNAVAGLYNNWGNEPDNSGNAQHAAGIGITEWPLGSGSLGAAGQWNDVNPTNDLYFIIEYSSILSIDNVNTEKVSIYPNPVFDELFVENPNQTIYNIVIYNTLGQTIKEIKINNSLKLLSLDFSNVTKGIYIVKLIHKNGKTQMQRIIK